MHLLAFQVNCLFFSKEDFSGQNPSISEHSGNSSAINLCLLLTVPHSAHQLGFWLQTQVDPCADFWNFLCITPSSLVYFRSLLEFFLLAPQSEKCLQAESQGNCRSHFISFSPLRDDSPILFVVQCRKTVVSYILFYVLAVYCGMESSFLLNPSWPLKILSCFYLLR